MFCLIWGHRHRTVFAAIHFMNWSIECWSLQFVWIGGTPWNAQQSLHVCAALRSPGCKLYGVPSFDCQAEKSFVHRRQSIKKSISMMHVVETCFFITPVCLCQCFLPPDICSAQCQPPLEHWQTSPPPPPHPTLPPHFQFLTMYQ